MIRSKNIRQSILNLHKSYSTSTSVHSDTGLNMNILEDYFNKFNLPYNIPNDLALRAITHKSIAGRFGEHQSRLTFLGRRTLKFQLMMHFINSNKINDINKIDKILDTTLVGNQVGNLWELDKVMRWISPSEDFNGIDKVKGKTVEAIIGAINHEYGMKVSEKVFNSNVLPNLKF